MLRPTNMTFISWHTSMLESCSIVVAMVFFNCLAQKVCLGFVESAVDLRVVYDITSNQMSKHHFQCTVQNAKCQDMCKLASTYHSNSWSSIGILAMSVLLRVTGKSPAAKRFRFPSLEESFQVEHRKLSKDHSTHSQDDMEDLDMDTDDWEPHHQEDTKQEQRLSSRSSQTKRKPARRKGPTQLARATSVGIVQKAARPFALFLSKTGHQVPEGSILACFPIIFMTEVNVKIKQHWPMRLRIPR